MSKNHLEVEFHSSVAEISKFPINKMPQFAFAGRSNAGKSSLINAITNRNKLAFVSATPGKTRLVNLFLLNKNSFLIDLPGFGYAKASNQQRDEIIQLVNDYLNQARELKILFLLCDALRLVPDDELDMIETCYDKKIKPVLVRTKIDKLNQKEKSALLDEKKRLELDFKNLNILFASSKSKEGIEEIKKLILN
jgi:GTP-binding protein